MPKKESVMLIEAIIRAVSKKWDILPEHIIGRSRRQPYAFTRQICMALSYHKTTFSLAPDGECFGNRDHGTVIHAIKVIDNALKDKAIAKIIKEILDEIE